MPSITRNGNDSISIRSMKAPGSPSSPLQMMYFSSAAMPWTTRHLRAVGKPAPPRPRRPLRSITSITAVGCQAVEALAQAGEAVVGEVFVEVERVEFAVMFGGDVLLAAEERGHPRARVVGGAARAGIGGARIRRPASRARRPRRGAATAGCRAV